MRWTITALVVLLLAGLAAMGLWNAGGTPGQEVSSETSNALALDSSNDQTTPPAGLDPEKFFDSLRAKDPLERLAALARAYQLWADQPGTGAARRRALEELLATEPLVLRARCVIAAVGGDGIPLDRDPHWQRASSALAEAWTDAEALAVGRELLITSGSSKAQCLIVASFAEYCSKAEVSEELRLGLTADFTDLYFTTSDPGLQKQIRNGTATIGGERIATALEGMETAEEDPDEVRERRRLLESLPEGERNELRQVSATLVKAACQPGTNLDAFCETVTALEALGDTDALRELGRRSPLVGSDADARACLDAALARLDH